MRLKFVFCIFLIADCAFVAAQCQSDDEYSYKRRLTFGSRITGGDKFESKDDLDHPWLVGFYNRKMEEFFCAGSLISNRHVLSAAHCFHQKGEVKATDPYHVMAMLGRFNVSDHDEAGSLNSLVWNIFIHPEWNFTDWKSNYDADISVVVLEDLVEFTAFIRPVRLPEPSDKSEVAGNGTVVGWGHDSESYKAYEETPSKIKVPAVLFRDCVLDAPKLLAAHSRRTFCAGFMGRSIAPCAGDSGGGFYVEDESKKNSIEGIVSNSAIQDIPGVCKTDIYTTYTIVANFVPWIQEKLRETKERVVKDVEYTCSGVQNGFTQCTAEGNENPLPDSVRFKLRIYPGDSNQVRELYFDFGKARVIEGISEAFPNLEDLVNPLSYADNRIERRTFANMTKLKTLNLRNHELITQHYFDDLVNLESLILMNCRMPKQPKNLFNVLKNLKVLWIVGGTNWKILPDETFANMSKLEELHLVHINLEEISENAFKDLVGLKELNLKQNSFKKLPNGLFKNLRSLKEIDLSWNKIEELSKELFANNLMLEKIYLRVNNIEELSKELFANNLMLKEIYLGYNKIEELSKELFANNLMLEEINLSSNKIKKIETDFTLLPKIRYIWLSDNVCYNNWSKSSRQTIQEFQKHVDNQCGQK